MARALPSITGLSYITVISLASTGDNKGAFVNKREREEKGNGQEELKEFAIAYQKPVDYKVLPVNGCFGGLGPRGGMVVHFFLEMLPLPKVVVHEITHDGKLGREKGRQVDTGQLVRQLQVGIVLDPGQAEDIAKWMLGKVDELKKASKVKQ